MTSILVNKCLTHLLNNYGITYSITLKRKITNVVMGLNCIDAQVDPSKGDKCLIMSLILLKRLSPLTVINNKNIYTFIDICILLSFKSIEDVSDMYYNTLQNIFYINHNKINMEISICKLLDYKIHINKESYNEMKEQLL